MQDRNYSADQLSVYLLIEFINNLEETGRAYSTINNYKCAILLVLECTNRCNPATLTLLNRRMKKLRKTYQKRPAETPQWDVNTVLTFLKSSRFEPLEEKSLQTILIKTIFLLILASGRRPSDPSGLCISRSTDWFIAGINKVILQFHPLFRPKAKSANFFPEPVTFSSLEDAEGIAQNDILSCPSRALRVFVKESEHLRSHAISYLLIHPVTGNHLKPAYLSRCIKTLILDAYKYTGSQMDRGNVQARHTRKIASSLAFHSGASLEDILRKSGWANPTTFINHYLITQPLRPSHPMVAAGSVIIPDSTALPSSSESE